MAKQNTKMVHCRYPKCSKLHESTELMKDDAVKGGNGKSYYHPDCYHTMQTVSQIRDIFIKEINPLLTGQQIGILVSIINNIIFTKNISVDYLKFAVEYFIRYKPGKLRQPFGLHYIIQDKDVASAWKKEEEHKIKTEMKQEADSVNNDFVFDLPDNNITYKNTRPKFSKILGV